MDYIIRTTKLSKTFRLDREQRTLFRTLRQGLRRPPRRQNIFYALKDIDIAILRGERIGVIGNNGSGKTTLLKILAGLHRPNQGKIHIGGPVSFIAGFGIGMVDELTVRENVFLYGAIYGMSREEIRTRFDEILDWAELREFAQAKLRTLSSGMRSRLAFSVSRLIGTDILLLDEALSAGDKNFNQKCREYFMASRDKGKTLIVATHDLDFVELFCPRTLWLCEGRQMAFGDTASVLPQYMRSG